jgi:hypothetical protein
MEKETLKKNIEETREKLNMAVKSGDKEQYYEISLQLDKLIEQYIECDR